jgi:hypothetical protein
MDAVGDIAGHHFRAPLPCFAFPLVRELRNRHYIRSVHLFLAFSSCFQGQSTETSKNRTNITLTAILRRVYEWYDKK